MKVTNVTQTCGACPSQWDAKGPNGEYVYVRFRHGWLSVTVNGFEPCMYEEKVGDGMDGVMDWATVEKLTGLRKQ